MRRVLRASERALLVEEAGLHETLRLLAALEDAKLPGVEELVPAGRSVLVRFDPSATGERSLRSAIDALEPGLEHAATAKDHVIPVHYDGEDLPEAAELLGVGVEELVRRHQAASWTVAFTGFAPGFGYLIGDDPLFDVPRRRNPRTRIPRGSVGLGGQFSGVYPRESPGGWQLIGQTDSVMWDIDRDPPALLAPGDRVRFEAVDRPFALAHDPELPVPASTPEHAIEILASGPQLLLEDAGRPGLAALGVSAAGAADRDALRAANLAVGNAAGEAVLEHAGGGAALRFRGPAVVAVTGADADVRVDGPRGEIQLERGVPVGIDDGDELRIGAIRGGLRVLIGIRGGIDLDPVLGSRASDTLAGLGPSPLQAGDVLPLRGPAGGERAVDPFPAPERDLPAPGDEVELRVVLGPRDDWFTAAGLETLERQAWTVTPQSDRVGVRLRGEVPLERSHAGELVSEGAVLGAIQVPADGQPVLFLADHPLTAGYPIIGAVIDEDLDLAGQIPPGAIVRFRVISAD